MKWIGNRISFVDEKKKTTIVISPEDVFWHKALLGAWFCMWLVIGGTMMWSLSLKLSDQEKIIVFVFLVFWAYYAIRVGRTFFWLLWGKEMIKVDETALTIKNTIKSYGKAVPYYLENIKKIRVNTVEANSIQAVWEKSPWIRGGERIEFDYMGKTIRFGRKVGDKDVKVLFNLLTKRIEEQLKAKKH